MNHLDDGTLQAFLDNELPPGDRAAAAEHLLSCTACRETQDELTRANAVVSDAVAMLDVAPPSAQAPTRPRTGVWGLGGSFVKAASLTLLVAAAASAAVPGSPVREWIARAVEPAPVVERPVAEVTPAEAVPVDVPVPVGVSLLVGSSVEIVVTHFEGTTLRLVETDGESVGIAAVGGEEDPVFSTAPGRIEVRDAVGGEVTIELPRGVTSARLTVDGDLYAEKRAGELRVLVPAETVDGASVWQ